MSKALLFVSVFGAFASIVPDMVCAQSQPQASTQLSEIIVTAQRREENVQNIPIAVNALTAAQIEAKGGTSSEDLSTLVPAVVYNPAVGGGQFTIRGIGGTNSGVDPGNAVYVDGVYQFVPASNLFEFNAVDRIEVLKGPQGTLFGRNSTGGLIQVITRDPSAQGFGGEAQIGYANYDTVSGNMYLNAPITDTLAANFAAYGFDQSLGWGRNLFTGAQVHTGYAWGSRSKLKWVAADGKTDITLSAYYNSDKPVASGVGSLPPGTRDALFDAPSPGIYNANSDVKSYRTDQQYTFSATIHRDLGFARFTSITAYDNVTGFAFIDADLTPAPIFNATLAGTNHTTSEEVHLESEQGSRLQWIVGVFYLYNRTPSFFNFEIGGFPTPSYTRGTTQSIAGFGQATYALTDDTKATLGLRYTSDNDSLAGHGALYPAPVLNKISSDKPTWRLALDHKFTPDVLGYISYSRGFKSSIFNPTNADHAAAGPETLDAYELGLKTESFDHRLRVNSSLFYYSFKQVQVQLFDPHGAYFADAGTARSYGLDLDAAAEPIRNLTLTGGLSLIDAKFTSEAAGAQFGCYAVPPAGVVTGNPFGNPPTAPFQWIVTPCSLVGKRLPFAPTFTGSAGASYKVPTQVGDFVLSTDYYHNNGYFVDPSNFAPARTLAYDMLYMSVTWTSPTGHLKASMWGKNLLNEQRIGSADVDGGFGNTTVAYPLAPLTFGATVGVKF